MLDTPAILADEQARKPGRRGVALVAVQVSFAIDVPWSPLSRSCLDLATSLLHRAG